jgi:uncharacterized membrane protein
MFTTDVGERTEAAPLRTHHQRARQIADLASDRAQLFVIAMSTVWFGLMYLHVWRRHDRFGTFDHDLGFHDHYVWLLARGKGFSDILGLHAFGHNATFGYYLFAPLSWLGSGPQTLNFFATGFVAAGAVFLFRYARSWIGSDALGVGVAAVYLLHPVTQLNIWETFHPENFAVAPIVAAYHASREQRWKHMVLWSAFAIIWKTDISLTLVMLGLLVLLRGHRRVGLYFAGAALVWFFAVSSFIVPQFGSGSTVFGPLFGDLGDSPVQVAKTAVTDPAKVLNRIDENGPVRYSRDLAAPLAFTSLASPGALLLGLPQATVNLLTTAEFTWNFRQGPHYQTLPVLALCLSMADGIAVLKRRRRELAGPAVSIALAAALATTTSWGALWPVAVTDGLWSADGDPRRPAREEAVKIVGDSAGISAHYLMVAHVAHRDTVFVFPNPWLSKYYYSPPGEALPDPVKVEYLIVDRAAVPPDGVERVLWECLLDSGAFEVRLDQSDLVVLARLPGSTQDRACIVPPP